MKIIDNELSISGLENGQLAIVPRDPNDMMVIKETQLIPLAVALLREAGAIVITEKPGGFRPTAIVYAGLSDRTEIEIGSTVIIIQGEK